MPNPREALTKAGRIKKSVLTSLTPEREDARPQITTLTQPYMFTIGWEVGQRRKPRTQEAGLPQVSQLLGTKDRGSSERLARVG